MAGQEIAIAAPDGTFMGYLAKPRGTPKGGAVVIQEIFGVNGFVREVANKLGAAGYMALAPDLFWRIEPKVELTDRTEAEWQKAFELYGKFNVDAGVTDIAATLAHLRTILGGKVKVGAVGYCLGGLLAYLTAARTDSDASVSYYGVSIDAHLGEADRITHPLLLHMAEMDQFVPPEARRKIEASLAGRPGITVQTYPNVDHAFARTGGQNYNAAAAKLADRRSLAFFAANLG